MKIKSIYAFTLIFGLLVACKSSLKNEKENSTAETSAQDDFLPMDLDTIKGMYIGDFDGSDIRIVINYISQNHAVGYNIHKGLQRNISGKVEETADELKVELHEPGDHEFDGVFELTFNKNDLSCYGVWKANSKKIPIKKFNLEKIVRSETNVDLEFIKLSDITRENFPMIFAYCSDSLGDLFFAENGLCNYEFYPKIDTLERVEQIISVKGSWTLTKEKELYVSWQKNAYFKDQKEKFEIVIGKESYDFYLQSGSRKIYPSLMGY
jgi:hypothetical protein